MLLRIALVLSCHLSLFSFAGNKTVIDTGKIVVVGKVSFEGNKKTKAAVLYRELSFKENDTLTIANFRKAIERSRQNLFNTSIFNLVHVDTLSLDSNTIIDVKFVLKERWYIWPIPIFEIYEPNFNTWWQTRNFARASYGAYLVYNNFRGRREMLMLKVRMGYNEQYGLIYNIPYLNKKQTIGLDIATAYSRIHEVIYRTENNKRKFLKYPDDHIRQDFYAALSIKYRQGLYTSQSLTLNYTQAMVSDTVRNTSNDYLINNQRDMRFLRIDYFFKHDMRDLKQYPLKGYYFDVSVNKLGLGILKTENLDLTFVSATYNNFFKLRNRLYYSEGVRVKLASTGRQPYYLQRGLGYGDFLRGYEYYIIDGQRYGVFKNNLKYQVITPHIKKLNFMPADKFNSFYYALYMGIFVDAGYVQDNYYYKTNTLANQFLYGYGVGMDLVTSYDMVMRVEYSLNIMNQGGIYLHFIAPI